MRKGFLAVALLGCAAVAGWADELKIPPAPPGHVLDEARLFHTEPERLAALSSRLGELHERTGFRLEVGCFSALIGSSVFQQSQILREEWLGDDPGLVLVVESDSGKWEIGWQDVSILTTEGGSKVPVVGANEISPQNRIKIQNQLAGLSSPRPGSTDDVESLVEMLIDGVDEALRPDAETPSRRGQVVMLGLGLLAGMLLIAMLIYAGVRRADRRLEDRLYFPAVKVGRRLGAPLGGGKLSLRTLRASP